MAGFFCFGLAVVDIFCAGMPDKKLLDINRAGTLWDPCAPHALIFLGPCVDLIGTLLGPRTENERRMIGPALVLPGVPHMPC